MISEISGDDLREPLPNFGNWHVPSLSQRLSDFQQLCLHSIPARLPSQLEGALTGLGTNESKPQKFEGFRLAEPAQRAVLRREAAELDQPGLLRMQRQRERPQPLAHRVPEAPGVILMLEAHDDVVGVPDHDHVARGLTPSPALGPEVENVMEIDVREQR